MDDRKLGRFASRRRYRPAIPKVRYSETMWYPYRHMPARRALDSSVAELLVILVTFAPNIKLNRPSSFPSRTGIHRLLTLFRYVQPCRKLESRPLRLTDG